MGHHLLCLIHVEDDPDDPIVLDRGEPIIHSGLYLLTHSVTKPFKNHGWDEEFRWHNGSLAEENQLLVHMASKHIKGDDNTGKTLAKLKRKGGFDYKIEAVNVNRLVSPLVGVQDPTQNRQTVKDFYYFLESPTNWPNLYMHAAKKETSKDREHYNEWLSTR